MDKLLDSFLPPELPVSGEPGTPPVAHEYADAQVEAQKKRGDVRTALVRKVDMPTFGTVEKFEGKYGIVVYVEANWGAHVNVGLQEGVQDVIASTFRLGAYT